MLHIISFMFAMSPYAVCLRVQQYFVSVANIGTFFDNSKFLDVFLMTDDERKTQGLYVLLCLYERKQAQPQVNEVRQFLRTGRTE